MKAGGKHTGLTGSGCAGWKQGVETSFSAGRGQEHVRPRVWQHFTLYTLSTPHSPSWWLREKAHREVREGQSFLTPVHFQEHLLIAGKC